VQDTFACPISGEEERLPVINARSLDRSAARTWRSCARTILISLPVMSSGVVGPEEARAFAAYFEKHSLPFTGLPDPTASVLKLYGQEVNLFKLGGCRPRC